MKSYLGDASSKARVRAEKIKARVKAIKPRVKWSTFELKIKILNLKY